MALGALLLVLGGIALGSRNAAVVRSEPAAQRVPVAASTSPPAPADASAAPAAPAAASPAGGRGPAPELLRCRDAVAAAEDVAAAARPGAAAWREHVDARTHWQSGHWTREQADAAWARTREAGPGQVRRLEAADERWQRVRDACDELPEHAAGAGVSPAVLEGCRDRAAAAGGAARAGLAVVADWADHLDKMAARRAEKLSPQRHHELWIEAWRAAPENLARFDAAYGELRDAPDCELPPSPAR